jgi:hypothetical protein
MKKIQLFEKKQIRSVWNEKTEEWYLSVLGVIEVLSDSVNPTDYLKKLRKRDENLGAYIGTNCPQIELLTICKQLKLPVADGKNHKLYLTGKETQYIEDAVRSGKTSGNGEFTKKCQQFFEQKYGFKNQVLANNIIDRTCKKLCLLVKNVYICNVFW